MSSHPRNPNNARKAFVNWLTESIPPAFRMNLLAAWIAGSTFAVEIEPLKNLSAA
jgi:hypothetical protein